MFEAYRQRYQKELLDSVVPFWQSHSIDLKYGGYFTCLDRFGEGLRYAQVHMATRPCHLELQQALQRSGTSEGVARCSYARDRVRTPACLRRQGS